MRTNSFTTLHPTYLLLAGLTAIALTGCSTAQGEETHTAQPATAETAEGLAAEAVTIQDAWVKAADSGMSAAFGTLENNGGTDVTVTAVSSPAASALELHETVEDATGQMVMQEKEAGFDILSGDSLRLEPGGDHFMLMGLVDPLLAGDQVTITITFSDDSDLEFIAPVKDYSGANETYHDDQGDHDGHEGDHGDHDEADHTDGDEHR